MIALLTLVTLVLSSLPTHAQPVAWARRAGGILSDEGYSIAVDASGNSYVSGYFAGTATFGNGITLTSTGQNDIFIAKYLSNGDLAWARRAGGTGIDQGNNISVDSTGNSYVIGYFEGTADFDNGVTLTSTGSYDIFVAKYTSNGNLEWARRTGGTGVDFGFGIDIDSAGHSYVTGYFNGTSTFGVGVTLTSSGPYDIFVAKYLSNGDLAWAKRAGGSRSDLARGISVDASGNSYVTGYFDGAITFDSVVTLTSAGDYDIFVAKYLSNGDLAWAKRAGGADFQQSNGIDLDSAGNSYVTGYFFGTATFGDSVSLTSAGFPDIFIAKYTSNGDLAWAKRAGGIRNDQGSGISVDSAGNSYVTGFFNGTATFGTTTLTSAGGSDIFVAKYDSTGTVLWAKRAGGISGENGNGIGVDSAGNSYVTGHFAGTATFDDSITLVSAGSIDIFVSKFGDLITNVPPTVDAGGAYIGYEGDAIALDTASAIDADTDSLAIIWSVNSEQCAISDSSALQPNLICSDDGTYEATLSVNDGINGLVTDKTTITINNVAPQAAFNAPATVDEGSNINVALATPSDPSSADTAAGFTYAFDCGDGNGYSNFGSTGSATCPTKDNGTRLVAGKIRDKDGGVTEYEAEMLVQNLLPAVGAISVSPTDLVEIGGTVSDAAGFNDPGTADTHICTINWGDAPEDVDGTVANSQCSGSHTYTSPGVYTIVMEVVDDDGGTGSAAYQFVVVYDPSGGFVTGGGWIESPPGAFVADPTLTGKANFGFVSKYQKGKNVPTGQTEFQFKLADLNFHSNVQEWLVVNQGGTNAQFKGSGTINGQNHESGVPYKFMIWAGDGSPDTFRIRIWWEDGQEHVVYDNSTNQALGGGSIVIHKSAKAASIDAATEGYQLFVPLIGN
jgi:hypothetical protein